MITGFRRSKNNGSIGNKLESFRNNLTVAFRTFDLLIRRRFFPLAFGTSLCLSQVPLVDNHYDAFSFALNLASNMSILCCQSLACIDYKQRHVAAINSTACAQHTIFLDPWTNTSASSDTGSINQNQFFALKLKLCVYYIAGCPWYLADNRPWEAKDGIEQGRFTDIRATNNGNTCDIFILLAFGYLFLRWKRINNAIKQIAGSCALDRGENNRFSKA